MLSGQVRSQRTNCDSLIRPAAVDTAIKRSQLI